MTKVINLDNEFPLSNLYLYYREYYPEENTIQTINISIGSRFTDIVLNVDLDNFMCFLRDNVIFTSKEYKQLFVTIHGIANCNINNSLIHSINIDNDITCCFKNYYHVVVNGYEYCDDIIFNNKKKYISNKKFLQWLNDNHYGTVYNYKWKKLSPHSRYSGVHYLKKTIFYVVDSVQNIHESITKLKLDLTNLCIEFDGLILPNLTSLKISILDTSPQSLEKLLNNNKSLIKLHIANKGVSYRNLGCKEVLIRNESLTYLKLNKASHKFLNNLLFKNKSLTILKIKNRTLSNFSIYKSACINSELLYLEIPVFIYDLYIDQIMESNILYISIIELINYENFVNDIEKYSDNILFNLIISKIPIIGCGIENKYIKSAKSKVTISRTLEFILSPTTPLYRRFT